MRNLLLLIVACSITLVSYGQSLRVGDKVPDIVMKGPDGEEIKLSALAGKVVLIDFWASWCKPCREENPRIVKTYHTYKDAEFKNGVGFTVFSVSLDQKDVAWKKAILTDSLIWANHVSDLRGWANVAAKLYQINSIPQSYLIDGEQRIICINPRGDVLEKALRKMRKKKMHIVPFFSK